MVIDSDGHVEYVSLSKCISIQINVCVTSYCINFFSKRVVMIHYKKFLWLRALELGDVTCGTSESVISSRWDACGASEPIPRASGPWHLLHILVMKLRCSGTMFLSGSAEFITPLELASLNFTATC